MQSGTTASHHPAATKSLRPFQGPRTGDRRSVSKGCVYAPYAPYATYHVARNPIRPQCPTKHIDRDKSPSPFMGEGFGVGASLRAAVLWMFAQPPKHIHRDISPSPFMGEGFGVRASTRPSVPLWPKNLSAPARGYPPPPVYILYLYCYAKTGQRQLPGIGARIALHQAPTPAIGAIRSFTNSCLSRTGV